MPRSCPIMRLNRKLASKVLVDLGMALTMLFSIFTGLSIWLFLPGGKQSGYSLFLGLSKHLWGDIHLYSSLAFAAILMVHLALNFRLFLSMVQGLISSESADRQ